MQSQIKIKGVNEPIEPYFDQNKYYNHGDNPLFKNFMKFSMQNLQGGYTIDHRTHIIDRAQRVMLARNIEDVMQRDMKCYNFGRAFAMFTAITLFTAANAKILRRLIPIGRFGIRNVSQTPFYHNFGPVGVVCVGLYAFSLLYVNYKALKFTASKFYYQVVLGQRDWLTESRKQNYFGNYIYEDQLLTNEANFPDSVDAKIALSLPQETFTWEGHYGTK